jgi:hypothetical protein
MHLQPKFDRSSTTPVRLCASVTRANGCISGQPYQGVVEMTTPQPHQVSTSSRRALLRRGKKLAYVTPVVLMALPACADGFAASAGVP